MNARELAFYVLSNFRGHPNGARALLDEQLAREALAPRDAGLARELALGVLRERRLLDAQIKPFLHAPHAKTDPRLLDVLRLGFYQHYFLERVPEHALVDQCVELAGRRVSRNGAKFVNAVLRHLLRAKPALHDDVAPEIRYSHPDWLAALLRERFGAEGALRMMQWNQGRPELHLRVNRRKISREHFIEQLSAELAASAEHQTLKCTAGAAPEAVIVNGSLGALEAREWFRAGLAAPQDLASQLVAQLLDPQPGESIVDWCAAPGSKSAHLAELTDGTARVLALDVDERRLEKIRESMRRLGHENVAARLLDPQMSAELRQNPADRILVDAPCSGLGTLRRNPDLRWTRRASGLEKLRRLQLEILAAAASCLKPGGTLVYSVCTFTRQECEAVVERFLARHPAFAVDADYEPPEFLRPFFGNDHLLRTFPPEQHCDGFFAARLKKSA